MSYKVGRRDSPDDASDEALKFEHLVKDKLVAAGFAARRVPLSGRQRPEGAGEMDIPNADLIVENKFFGKAKTTKAKKYVSFPEGEIMELARGKQDFLVFNFSRTPPFVVVRFEDFLDLLRMWKETGRAGSKGAAASGKEIPAVVPEDEDSSQPAEQPQPPQ
ncbi:MAG: hypothetical protein V1813_02385 [Candidatus Aenigmatarchaeota archaeon]